MAATSTWTTNRDDWQTNRARRARARLELAAHTTWPAPCAICGTPLQPGDPWHLGHTQSRREHPELTWDPRNHRVECPTCSRRGGAQLGRAIQLGHIEPEPRAPTTSPRNPFLLAPHTARDAPSPEISPRRAGNGAGNVENGPHGDVTESRVSDYRSVPWVAHVAREMGPCDVWPRLMTGPHPAAVGSYGLEAITRIETRRLADPLVPAHEKPLRFFQKLIIVRAYEHDADGALVWGTVLQTTNRQVGKSVLVREVAIDRGWHAQRLGEDQLVVHIARDLSVAEEVQRPARAWARVLRQEGDGRFKAIDTNGKAEVSGPGFRWVARSEKGAYGWSASLAPADECWDIEPATIHNALEPTMAARREPQLWLLSTSHENCTALFPEFRNQALEQLDAPGRVLLLEWSAPGDLEDDDPVGWRAASPWFDEKRRELIAGKVGSHGFAEQWLNRWPVVGTRVEPGVPLLSEEVWRGLEVAGRPVWVAVAVESSYGEAPVVAFAARDGERVLVSVVQAASMVGAVELVQAAGLVTPPQVGKSLLGDPVWADVAADARRDSAIHAVEGLGRLLADDMLRHDGGLVLSGQVLGVRTAPTLAGGARIVSEGRTDAIKAVVWAAAAARQVVESPAIW